MPWTDKTGTSPLPPRGVVFLASRDTPGIHPTWRGHPAQDFFFPSTPRPWGSIEKKVWGQKRVSIYCIYYCKFIFESFGGFTSEMLAEKFQPCWILFCGFSGTPSQNLSKIIKFGFQPICSEGCLYLGFTMSAEGLLEFGPNVHEKMPIFFQLKGGGLFPEQ